MKVYRFFIQTLCLITFCALVQQVEAQAYRIHRKVVEQQLFVRWEPVTTADYFQVVDGEMTLEFYQVNGAVTEPELQLIERKSLVTMALDAWMDHLGNGTNWDSIAITAAYPEKVERYYLEQTFGDEQLWTDPAMLADYRHRISNYALNHSWPAIEHSGFGYSTTLSGNHQRYALKLYPTANGDTLWIDLDLTSYEPPRLPELEAEFKNRKTELKWRTIEFKRDFFGWYLERSLDEGEHWENLFGPPLVNSYDTVGVPHEALKYLHYDDILPENDLPVQYRLRGADYLGGRSVNRAWADGAGREDIRNSPLLLRTEQTDSNYALITWEVRPEEADLIREFQILHTDTTGVNYRVALAEIDPAVREVVVPMKFRSNFFRVQAVSHVGTELASFESLVMCYDVTPPAVPGEFTGYIDTTGLAHLSWVVSDEVDLNGYYLFKGYYTEEELAMITPEPLAGPAHIDSVDMKIGNEWVYYQLRSVDTRGNGSGFTPLLKLKKPDVHPPAPPQFTHAAENASRIELKWTTSPALDVAEYALYRQAVDTEDDFALLLSFYKDDFRDTYVDSLVQTGSTYRYTLLATDDDGLESAPARPITIRVRASTVSTPISAFAATTNEDGTVTVSWAYDAAPAEFQLYKGKDDEPLSLLKMIDGDTRTYRDEAVRLGSTYRYLLQALYRDGKTSPYTEEIIIELIE